MATTIGQARNAGRLDYGGGSREKWTLEMYLGG